MDPGELKFLNALNAVPGVGAATLRALRDCFGSFERAWRADERAVSAVRMDDKTRTALAAHKKSADPERMAQKLSQDDIWIITDDDPLFPPLLREIASPPVMLYGRGDKTILAPAYPVAVVGTRRPTPYGVEAAETIAGDLAEAGITIVSGLAAGIDAKAHAAALARRGVTVAVLGCGTDRQTVFPPENRGLADRIAAGGGAVISEYAPGTPAVREHFPMRNRIIAGLSRAVIVVEAREKSGALITARMGLEENRDIMALPGSVFSPASAGPNRLIREGARAITSGADVLEEFGLDAGRVMRHHAAQSLNPEETIILSSLDEPLAIDAIRAKTGIPTGALMASLSLLELKGLVRGIGGDTFQKA
jgi:DNA processing protein